MSQQKRGGWGIFNALKVRLSLCQSIIPSLLVRGLILGGRDLPSALLSSLLIAIVDATRSPRGGEGGFFAAAAHSNDWRGRLGL